MLMTVYISGRRDKNVLYVIGLAFVLRKAGKISDFNCCVFFRLIIN